MCSFRCCKIVFPILLSFIIYFAVHIPQELGLFTLEYHFPFDLSLKLGKDISPFLPNKHCIRIPSIDFDEFDSDNILQQTGKNSQFDREEWASEDLVHFRDRVYFYGTGNLQQIFEYGYKKGGKTSGGIRVLNLTNVHSVPGGSFNGTISNYKVDIENLPKDRELHIHGIFYSKLNKRLYAVNHGVQVEGGKGKLERESVIEVIDVSNNTDGIHGTGTVRMRYVGTIRADIPYSQLNDVVELSKNEVFATAWNPNGMPITGTNLRKLYQAGEYWTMAKWIGFELTYFFDFKVFASTGVYYCKFDESTLKSGGKSSCEFIARGFFGANGIAINKRRDELYVVDAPQRLIKMYTIHHKTKDVKPTLKHIRDMVLPDGPDDIEMVDFSNDGKPVKGEPEILSSGAIPLFSAFLKQGSEYAHGVPADKQTRVPGTMILVDVSTGTSDRIFTHDGNVLSEFSSCLPVTVDSNFMVEEAICGTPFKKGVILCNLDV